ncbi:MAG TPA: hypothetical protein VGQ35_04885, partial [Dongiaceae bacterium]|nr:hypothetical protein [Dongiaceae bacterium]
MSSGERAKPPATYEERNPFDISRRSGKDVAAEIAQRMAAWKQARGRSYATRSAVPSAEAKQAPIAAPVQPARLPKFAEHAGPAQRPVPRPANPPLPPRADASAAPRRAPASAAPASTPTDSGSPASAGARIPFFASFSAVQRAMPPAPSLKRPAARREPAPDTINIEAPHIEMPAPESHEADSRAAASPQVAIPEQAEIENPVVAPAGDAHGAAAPLEAEASAASVVEARDIAAPDADAPADAEAAAAPVVETPDRDTHRIETVEAPIAETASQAIEAEVPTIDRPVAAIGETEAVTPAAAETPDRDTHRVEAHRDTPAAETRGTEPAAHAIDEQDL